MLAAAKYKPQPIRSLFVTGRRRYLSHLPDGWRKRFLYWWFVKMGKFFYLKLATPVPVPEEVNGEIRFDSWREGQGVYLTRAEGEATHQDRTWFTQELPFGSCLPSETCQFGDFIAEGYERRELQYVAVEREKLKKAGQLHLIREAQPDYVVMQQQILSRLVSLEERLARLEKEQRGETLPCRAIRH